MFLLQHQEMSWGSTYIIFMVSASDFETLNLCILCRKCTKWGCVILSVHMHVSSPKQIQKLDIVHVRKHHISPEQSSTNAYVIWMLNKTIKFPKMAYHAKKCVRLYYLLYLFLVYLTHLLLLEARKSCISNSEQW